MRDYLDWHRTYDNPGSGMSWRLRTVQRWIADVLDQRPGPLRVLSLCAGDGRDLLEVLGDRADRDRVQVTLVELHPGLVVEARTRAAEAGLHGVEVREADAGTTEACRGAVPADLVLLVGIFGNISDADVRRTIDASPQLCAPGATLLWSRGRHDHDLNGEIRDRFAGLGFVEVAYAAHDAGSLPAVGQVRFDGTPQPLSPDLRLFDFLR